MSRAIRYMIMVVLTALAGAAAMLSTSAVAAERPVKEFLETKIGWQVNFTKVKAVEALEAKGGKPTQTELEEENVCTVSSKDECQSGGISGEPQGLAYPLGVAAGPAPEHYLYVSDRSNDRIQVFTPQGSFVRMFGWEVDRTTKENVCTAVSAVKHECQPGQPVVGGPAGQIAEPTSVAVDQKTGDAYVLDWSNHRIEKYTSAGEFILMIGGEVNETEDGIPGATEEQKNTCTEEEIKNLGVKCKAGVESPACVKHGAFKFERERGNLLAVDAKGVLYVGDEGCVQEFDEHGKYVHGLPTSGTIEALAVDGAGNVYFIESETVVRKLTPAGEEVKPWPHIAKPREPTGFNLRLAGLAVDPSGRVATTETEIFLGPNYEREERSFGFLLSGVTAEPVAELTGAAATAGIAFSDSEAPKTGGFEMYTAAELEQQVLAYRPVPVAELVIATVTCLPGAENATDATFNCSLMAQVDPWEVSNTEVWFEWGGTPALGTSTPVQVICTTKCESTLINVSALVEGLRPHDLLYDQLAGYDQNDQPPAQPLTSQQASFSTQTVPPKIVGKPSISFVGPSSAVMSGEVNPENAETKYFAEYGPCQELATCLNSPYSSKTTTLKSGAYGAIYATFEASGLQPETSYHYRLGATNEKGEPAVYVNEKGEPDNGEGVFTTALAPKVQAETGLPSNVTATSAVVSGVVNSDGQAAIYTFELGIYNGANTQYGVVFSGSIAASTISVPEQLLLSGLQPGTEYAYRITVRSGYGESIGAVMKFTTVGLPSVLILPALLPILATPNIAFPAKCKRGYELAKHGKCVKVRRKTNRVKGRGKRARRKASRHRKHGKGARR